MTSTGKALAADLAAFSITNTVTAVEAAITVAPGSVEEIAGVIAVAATHGATVVPVGSGSMLAGSRADIALSTHRLAGIIDYQPDDLTVVVGAGTRLVDLEAELAERWHTAVLPERSPERTVGGVVASAASGYRRLKYGPTRDRVLEVTMATGYGDVVRGGGRLVKNVTGYDLPRLMTGSHGSLGIVGSVCFKLWPAPPHRVTVAVDDPAMALANVYRPVAVLETADGSFVYLEGDEATVQAQATSVGGTREPGFAWPEVQQPAVAVSLRVPARCVAEAVDRVQALQPDWFVAQHGVGVIDVGVASTEIASLDTVRAWAESTGGALVVTAPGLSPRQRWGAEPQTIDIQRRLKSLFDPSGVCNPGALPGGL